jgi:NSS family neurotransmitter:Na+ symporter
MSESTHGAWSSRIMFILAAAGSAVGLGNIWRFPYIVGENGGGVFVLTYLACIFLIGIPILISEVTLGRAGRQSPINSMRSLAERSNAASSWQVIGWMGALAGFMILSFYAVIAGWAIAYLLEMLGGSFIGADSGYAEDSFSSLTADPWAVGGWHTLFMVVTIFIAARGVSRGLETTVKYLMPMLFILLFALVVWAGLTSGHFLEGLVFMFSFKAQSFSGEAVLMAMGQAFFTLSLGMGAIMAYGAYLPKSASIVGSAVTIALLDTSVALLSGMVIFPIVFANGLESSAGPGLMFITLPLAFGQMTGGQVFGSFFFLLVTFAAITSAISLVEPAIAWLVEKFKVTRVKAAITVGLLAWFIGLGSAFSFNIMADITLLPGKTFFDTMDYVSNNVMLPIGGVLIAIFTGWFFNREMLSEELGDLAPWLKSVLMFLVRIVAPVGVLVLFIMSFS